MAALPAIAPRASGSEKPPLIREHKIPSPRSEPYICMEGPDAALWFCESGASKIGRFDPADSTFREFPLPVAGATPTGLTVGSDGNMWFCCKKANKIGRITMRGDITLFDLPTPNAGPDGTLNGPDGNVWFSESDANRIGRITPDGQVTEFSAGISPGARPLSIAERDGSS